MALDNDKISNSPHVVGIGASAGGLEALEAFFQNMPEDAPLAFIVIQHLSPDYKSLMVELLSKKTKLQVQRAEEGMEVEIGNIYLIPPKKNLRIFHHRLLLDDKSSSTLVNLPIDIFLQSLAEDCGEKAIAVILSGTGSDGTRGVRQIKECGGLILVQDETSAKFDGMPKSAIATGTADFIMPPEDMPAQLLSYISHPYVSGRKLNDQLLEDGDSLTRIFSKLREKTKIDFTHYKPNTVSRRIERRMSVNQVSDLDSYVKFISTSPGEITALYKDLLIGVTSFFRDQEVMQELGEIWLPELLKSCQKDELRFWVAGCSTGEEAYTLGIIAREVMESTGITKDIKIFATDIDADAINVAGSGRYPESITCDIAPNLLAKYFVKNEDSYHISRRIREMVVFARHNLLNDPPFTNISLLSCRNLLIYLQSILQVKAFDMFNFSLNQDGILLLGTSETIGDRDDYFAPLNQKLKLYKSLGKRRQPHDTHLTMRKRPTDQAFKALRQKNTFREDNERLLATFLEKATANYLPLSAIVNEHMDIIHIIGDRPGFFRLSAGPAHLDITRTAPEPFSIPLATGLQKVFRTQEELRYSNIHLKQDGKLISYNINIIPITKGYTKMAAVFFEQQKLPEETEKIETSVYDINHETEQRIKDLERELQFAKENLQATIEELETTNEELQATNEELLASNEELQSTNEELQSTNEELYTVNSELQNNIIELTERNNDVDNLLTSSRIGTLLLTEDLEIRRFSHQISNIFNIIESDIGRPIDHIRHRLKDSDPIKLIDDVAKTGEPRETEVLSDTDTLYLLRILPYTIGPESYAGIVLTCIDISKHDRVEKRLADSEKMYQDLFATMATGVVYQDRQGKIISANPAAERLLGLSLDQMRGVSSFDPRWKTMREDGTPLPGDQHPAMVSLQTGKPVYGFVMGVFNPVMESTRWLIVSSSPQFHENEKEPYQVYTTFEDITDRALPQFSCSNPECSKTKETKHD